MFKRWRCCVALALCLCCTFATLSLNTLYVNASTGNVSTSFSTTFVYDSISNSTSGVINGNSGGGGTMYNGSGSIASITGGGGSITSLNIGGLNAHVRVPVLVKIPVSGSGVTSSSDQIVSFGIWGINLSSSGGTVSNLVLTNQDGSIEYSTGTGGSVGQFHYDTYGKLVTSNYEYFVYNFWIEYDFAYSGSVNTTSNVFPSITSDCTFSFAYQIRDASESEKKGFRTQTQEVNSNSIKNSTESTANNTSEIKTTTSGILSKITDFFNGFFQNFINSLKSLFIPEDGYFTTWFSNLNTLLSQKLGMLYAPFDLIISTLTALASASTSEAGIPIPEIGWDGTVLIPAQTFYFSSLGSSFNNLRDAVYFGTDVILLFAFLTLLQRKIQLVMRGHESD